MSFTFPGSKRQKNNNVTNLFLLLTENLVKQERPEVARRTSTVRMKMVSQNRRAANGSLVSGGRCRWRVQVGSEEGIEGSRFPECVLLGTGSFIGVPLPAPLPGPRFLLSRGGGRKYLTKAFRIQRETRELGTQALPSQFGSAGLSINWLGGLLAGYLKLHVLISFTELRRQHLPTLYLYLVSSF